MTPIIFLCLSQRLCDIYVMFAPVSPLKRISPTFPYVLTVFPVGIPYPLHLSIFPYRRGKSLRVATLSPARRAEVGEHCCVCTGGSGLAYCALPLSLMGPMHLSGLCSAVMAPFWVRWRQDSLCEWLPGLCVSVEDLYMLNKFRRHLKWKWMADLSFVTPVHSLRFAALEKGVRTIN